MIDTMRQGYPADMMQAAQRGPIESESGRLEAVATDLLDHAQRYAREKPLSAALWALGIGFFLGWKLKPW